MGGAAFVLSYAALLSLFPKFDWTKTRLLCTCIRIFEEYRERHAIRPGITGLSQIRLGYVKTLEATSKKTSIDNNYIENLGYIIELKIILNTILIIMRGLGK